MTRERGNPDNGVMFGSIVFLILTGLVFWLIIFLLDFNYSFLWALGFLFVYPLAGRGLVFCTRKVFLAYRKAGGGDNPKIFNESYPDFILLGSVAPFATILILIYWLLAYFLTAITSNN
jgi:hypothetical protein